MGFIILIAGLLAACGDKAGTPATGAPPAETPAVATETPTLDGAVTTPTENPAAASDLLLSVTDAGYIVSITEVHVTHGRATVAFQFEETGTDEDLPPIHRFQPPLMMDIYLNGLSWTGEFMGTGHPIYDPDQPRISPTPGVPPPIVAFVLEYDFHLADLDGSDPVEIAFTTLRFDPPEGTPPPNLVEGDWTFRFVPSELAAGTAGIATATPAATPLIPDHMGRYEDVTFDQAQDIVPFHLVMPEPLPEDLDKRGGISILAGPPDIGDIYIVSMNFGLADDPSPRMSMSFVQQNQETRDYPLDDGREESVVEIGGKEITEIRATSPAGTPTLIYLWQDGEVYRRLYAELHDDRIEALARQVVEAAIRQEGASQAASPEGDSALPTPEASGIYRGVTFEQAQKLTPFTLVLPDPAPDELGDPSFLVNGPPAGHQGNIYRVDAYFPGNESGADWQTLIFTQMNSGLTVSDSRMDITTIVINGRDVQRGVSESADGIARHSYWWEQDGVSYLIMARLDTGITEQTIEDFVAAIP